MPNICRLVHAQNEMQWYSIHKYYSSPIIYKNTPTPAGYLIERIDKNILPAIYLLFRTSRNDRFLATQ